MTGDFKLRGEPCLLVRTSPETGSAKNNSPCGVDTMEKSLFLSAPDPPLPSVISGSTDEDSGCHSAYVRSKCF